ncbi:hypothetical protein D3C87_324640 [compost metagenome]
MNVGELKNLIEHLSDETPVVECRSGNVSLWTGIAEIERGDVYIGTRWSNAWKDYIPTEWNRVERMHTITDSYSALIFKTED